MTWIAVAALALALAIASHVLLPFIAVLLILAALCDLSPDAIACPRFGAVVALAADAAIWILIFMSTSARKARATITRRSSRVALLAPGIAMFCSFAASVMLKTVLQRAADRRSLRSSRP